MSIMCQKKCIILFYLLSIFAAVTYAESFLRQPDPLYKFLGKNGKWGFFDENKKVVIPPQFEDVNYFHEGNAVIMTKDKLFMIINQYGKVITPSGLTFIKDFREGLAAFCVINSSYPNGKWGYINTQGKMVIPPVYDYADFFIEGVAAVGMNISGKAVSYGYINKQEDIIIPFTYSFAVYFSEGIAAVMNSNGKYGFIDKKGNLIINYTYDYASFFNEGLCIVGMRNKEKKNMLEYGYINKQGKMVISPVHHSAEFFSDGVAIASLKKGDTVRVRGYDKTGSIIESIDYSEGQRFSNKLCAVKKNGKWGYIDPQGKVMIPFKFDQASSFVGSYASVGIKNKKGSITYFYIDRKGNQFNVE